MLMTTEKPKRYYESINYPEVRAFEPAADRNQHKVFVVGMLRRDLGGQVVPDVFGAQWLCEATYLKGHSDLLILQEGCTLVPPRGDGVEIKGDVYVVSKDCLWAMDRLSQALYYHKRAKVKVWRNDDGTMLRAWCHFARYPEKFTSKSYLSSGDYKLAATKDSIAFTLKAAKCKSGELKWSFTGYSGGSSYKDSAASGKSGAVAEERAGATCSLPTVIGPTGESNISHDASVDGRTAYQLRYLKEGETRTVKDDRGNTVVYTRKGGVLTVKEWIAAKPEETVKTTTVSGTIGFSAPHRPSTAEESAKVFEAWEDRQKQHDYREEDWLSDEEKEARRELIDAWAKEVKAKAEAKKKRESDNKAAMGGRITNCVYCDEEIYWMPHHGWITWDAGSPKCLESVSEAHKPEPVEN